ncbi:MULTISPECIES: hypothetical protein [unclassified Curtobacterium]|uniref:hypothetical protein n=1 Tax=unclassified Curtobacterium TaxID=257496 RepID=UPI001587A321|nr:MULTISPECIES: hypothetical protein [unclassified Curtobacterium]
MAFSTLSVVRTAVPVDVTVVVATTLVIVTAGGFGVAASADRPTASMPTAATADIVIARATATDRLTCIFIRRSTPFSPRTSASARHNALLSQLDRETH